MLVIVPQSPTFFSLLPEIRCLLRLSSGLHFCLINRHREWAAAKKAMQSIDGWMDGAIVLSCVRAPVALKDLREQILAQAAAAAARRKNGAKRTSCWVLQ